MAACSIPWRTLRQTVAGVIPLSKGLNNVIVSFLIAYDQTLDKRQLKKGWCVGAHCLRCDALCWEGTVVGLTLDHKGRCLILTAHVLGDQETEKTGSGPILT